MAASVAPNSQLPPFSPGLFWVDWSCFAQQFYQGFLEDGAQGRAWVICEQAGDSLSLGGSHYDLLFKVLSAFMDQT